MDVRAFDLTGQRFGRLVATLYVRGNAASPGSRWLCECDCGKSRTVSANSLRGGHTQSCGCLRLERQRAAASAMARHGMSTTPVYAVWTTMIARCHNPKSRDFAAYGARGIHVCERWRDFAHFYADMGDRPAGRSIDRINNALGYEPGNCRWATAGEQVRNSSRARLVLIDGKSQCVLDWCAELGISLDTVRTRLSKGWEVKRALLTAPNASKSRSPSRTAAAPATGATE